MKQAIKILLGSILVWTAAQSAALSQQQTPKVEVANPVVKTIIDFDLYTGRFEAAKSVNIQARVSGYLMNIGFQEGGLVEEGDLLFEIDARPFEAAVAQAKAQLEVAKAAQKLALANNERAAELLRRRVGSKAEADTTAAVLSQAVANIALAEARLQAAQLDLDFTKIRSPIKGRISATNMDVGNLVTTNSNLTRIVSLDPIEFRFTVSEEAYLRYARLARQGERQSSRENANTVSARLSGENSWDRKGKMSFVDNVLDPNSGTIEGRALFENSDMFLIPGAYARLRLPASGEYEAIMIPDRAILSDQSRKIVYVLTANNKVEERVVVTGPMHLNMRVIRDGLTAEDRVIVRGQQRARAGAEVEPTEVELELARIN
ncbi:MAG: efflux RND transporter periplasmic adaptor subunit [Pseudomonadota bacterium]